MSEEKKKPAEPLFEYREYEADLFAPAERRVEVKAEREAEVELMPDMGSMVEGIMQPMMMMLTLGMVMPVMQQAMVGVLQSTEVTVVVKPGSIVSVEITNSVLAVEVEGGNVNVTLEHSTIMLPVDLQGATIMMPIDIQGATIMMPIDVQGATIMMPVDIQAQYVTLEVNITRIEEAVINILEASKIGINISAQSVGVFLEGTYETKQGKDVNLRGFTHISPFETDVVLATLYAFSKKYMIEGISVAYRIFKDTLYRPDLVIFGVYVDGTCVIRLSLSREKPSDTMTLLRAISLPAGSTLQVKVSNLSSQALEVECTVYMYEVS